MALFDTLLRSERKASEPRAGICKKLNFPSGSLRGLESVLERNSTFSATVASPTCANRDSLAP